MATFTSFGNYDWYSPGNHAWSGRHNAIYLSGSSSLIVYNYDDGTQLRIVGTFTNVGPLGFDATSVTEILHTTSGGTTLEAISGGSLVARRYDLTALFDLALADNDVFTGSAGRDSMGDGSGGNDTFTGGAGADVMNSAVGDDVFVLNAGDYVAGEYIDGGGGNGGGTNELRFVDAGVVDLSIGNVSNVHTFRFLSGVSDVRNVNTATQIAKVIGSAQIDSIGFIGNFAQDFSFLTFENWTDGVDRVSIVDGTVGTSMSDVMTTVNIVSMKGGGGNDTITGNAFGNVLEGESGNNSLNGGGGNDTLIGGAGADNINGGSDIDTASYAGSTATVQVFMYNMNYNTGDALGDAFTGIEAVQGSSNIDVLVGGFLGDSIFGGEGGDWLDGTYGGDSLFGQAGNDSLVSRLQADILDGGADFDYARYDYADAGLRAYLYDRTQNSGWAAGDIYGSIEGLAGSYFADDLRGDASQNIMYGLGGADFIIGLGGSDLLIGGAGQDLFHFVGIGDGGAGGDAIQDFVSGQDRISVTGAFFGLGSPGGVAIDSWRFVEGSAANLATSQFIYNAPTSQLWYDQDGTGAGAQVLLATLQAGAAMAAGDIIVI